MIYLLHFWPLKKLHFLPFNFFSFSFNFWLFNFFDTLDRLNMFEIFDFCIFLTFLRILTYLTVVFLKTIVSLPGLSGWRLFALGAWFKGLQDKILCSTYNVRLKSLDPSCKTLATFEGWSIGRGLILITRNWAGVRDF